ncbi:MAG: phosphoribosyltransferase family protein [Bacteroidetes bacterium]|nr:phosphoribosyltransferase family protein [Bacteroidota bacterium]MDA1120937.1 phosphoribosyltransferase family protein [Bacteroidota bacterium]
MTKTRVLILTKKAVTQKIRRMSYEIYENNFEEKELIVAGILENGYVLAKKLKKELEQICPIKIRLVKLNINKDAPLEDDIKIDCEMGDLKNKSVILVDDVLSTGRTMAFSLRAFLNAEIKKMEAAVLVDRSHKLFPVEAKFKGYELSTTLNEHVEVKLIGDEQGVYLA